MHTDFEKVYSGLKSGEREFNCRKCGDCCSGGGYVFLNRGDAVRISLRLELDPDKFRHEYLESCGDRTRLRGSYSAPCLFFKNSRCSVYEERPGQCRTFPFWLECMESADSFEDSAGFCRGIKLMVQEAGKEG